MFLELLRQRRGRLFGGEHNIAALLMSPHLTVSGGPQQFPKLRHADPVVGADVDAAE